MLASQIDSLAKSFVAERAAALVTPRDLCTEGWTIEVGNIDRSYIVADGVARPASEITGMLNLMPFVYEQELVTIEPADRSYVSAEITAFLFYLLNALPCPILNRPAAECLAGTGWRHEQWALACRKVGIQTGPITRGNRGPVPPESVQPVAVLGDQFVEGQDHPLAARVIALADLAQVTFLQVNLADAGTRFHSVQLTPQLHNDRHRAAVCRFFELD